ncbi:GlxA family transcriptional regulator [Rhizobium sp. FKL33]|uniref:GlxA family transcriptional regulator n=1 Tax=Rhizobium sp. FKL33 TaxID=2562307 RepID=UPI0010C0F88D|nr:GlxA family transcriptional regulator [Rhizobium sp. FKL33]
MKASQDASGKDRLKIGFILSRSFTLSAFALFVDTLRLASDEADRSGRKLADWQVLGNTRHLIASSCGVQVAPTSDLVDPRAFDYIVVVGGLLNTSAPVDEATIAYLKRAAGLKIPLIGVCTGTFILAEAGLMTGHQTCVSWLHYDAFRERFPDLSVRADRLFNLDRMRGSCAGGSSAADMAATIVRRHISSDAERNALEVLQIEKARSALDIQPRRPLSIDSDDPRLKAALIIMERNMENALSIPKLAAAVGVSRRQLERLFQDKAQSSPALIYKRMRLEKAKQLLLQTKAPLIDIATQVGYDNASHFARLFREAFGERPTKFRTAAKSKAANVVPDAVASLS